MEPRDYQGDALLHDGILVGLGTSAAIHMAVFFLVMLVSWLMPVKESRVPVCTVSLLAVEDAGGGSREGGEGAVSKGNGEPAPVDRAELVPAPADFEDGTIIGTEQEKLDVVHIPDKKEVLPIPKKVEKPKDKPKEKPKPASGKPLLQQAAAVETPPPGPDVAKSPEGVPGGLGEGVGGSDALGSGKAYAGSGPRSASGEGPPDLSFGSGDGPRFLNKVRPEYPKLAREMKKEGTVLLCLTIDERGKLMNVEIVKPAGSGFDEEAVRCVKASRFSPARKKGKPVLCRAHLPIRFVLKQGAYD